MSECEYNDEFLPGMSAFWASIARDAAEAAADYRDEGQDGAAANWAGIARLRATVAVAAAQASMAESLADIANALRDDEGNNVAHILHNMSYTLAQLADNSNALAAWVNYTGPGN